MGENYETCGPATTQIMGAEIKKMMLEHGAASSSLLSYIRSRIKPSWVHDEPYFHATDDDSTPITIDTFFAKLKNDPNFANQFAAEPSRISLHDATRVVLRP